MKFSILFLLVITSCASTGSKKSAMIVEQADARCLKTAKLYSEAFSLIPFIAPQMAKSILESKAEEMKANTVVIDQKEGFFHVKYQASGYNCITKK